MAGVLSLPSGSNNKALRRAPASDALKSRTGFQCFNILVFLMTDSQGRTSITQTATKSGLFVLWM
ncbi:Hypothetical protein P9303_28511 [Prochlorococcus marinus str. MIT 9303]|uniref:Uncharacterized protein n=2 Tax=Prochlorococcus marinus TaxID=1219 RepID=A2CDM1_PROM3|nr:Hypothetical protein P9303_28511 [Prochlorococcus marinus str. MIT 9303]